MAGPITVFGGTGFIGRHLVALLLQSGATVRVAVRHPGRVEMAAEPAKAPEIVQADIPDDTSVGSAIRGSACRLQPRRHSHRDSHTDLSRHSRRRCPPSSAGGTAPGREA